MSSTVPAIFSPDSILENDPFPASETDVTQWDWSQLFSTPEQSTESARLSGSGSNESKQNLISNESGSNNDPNQLVPDIDERKRRRMISNRDSARRSRMRKRNHLVNLTNEVKQLRIENQELLNRLKCVSDQNHCLKIDNDRVRFEYSAMQQELLDMRRVMLFR